MELNLPVPISQDSPSFTAWLNDNIRILQESLRNVPDMSRGFNLVTGTGLFTTGLTRVDGVVASFRGDPTLGAMTLAARPDATVGSVRIRVFDSTAVLSTAPVFVEWIAFGLRT